MKEDVNTDDIRRTYKLLKVELENVFVLLDCEGNQQKVVNNGW